MSSMVTYLADITIPGEEPRYLGWIGLWFGWLVSSVVAVGGAAFAADEYMPRPFVRNQDNRRGWIVVVSAASIVVFTLLVWCAFDGQGWGAASGALGWLIVVLIAEAALIWILTTATAKTSTERAGYKVIAWWATGVAALLLLITLGYGGLWLVGRTTLAEL